MEQNKSLWLRILEPVVLGLAALGFLLICSLSTTPLLSYEVGQDAAFFRLVGQGMTQGLLPYRDFFDMKGPYLFWMEYLGQRLLFGRLGVFLVQWVCLTVSLVFAKKSLDLAFPEKGCPLLLSLLLMLPCAVILSYTMQGGGLTEELSLPFLMPCLYVFLRYLRGTRLPSPENQDHPPLWGFLYGLVFGIMALIRITNAALLGAILLTVTVNLFAWKRFRNFFSNVALFLLGILVGVLPGLLWAWWRGILGDMLNQVFVLGFRYSGEAGLIQKILGLMNIWPCLFTGLPPLIVLLIYRVRDWKSWLFTLSSLATLLLAAAMGNGYAHYFVLSLPLVVYGAYLLTAQTRKHFCRRAGDRVVCLILSVLLLLGSLAAQWPLIYSKAIVEIRYAMYCARTHQESTREYDDLNALVSQVPEGEDVYFYGSFSCSRMYILSNRMPPLRYCDWQSHYILLMPGVGETVTDYMKNGSYVLTPQEEVSPREIQELLQKDYEILDTRDNMILWVRKAE